MTLVMTIAAMRKRTDAFLAWCVMLGMAAMTADVLWMVLSRQLSTNVPALGLQPARWADELATMLLIWITMLGAALAYGKNQHLGLDYLFLKFDPAAQRLTMLLRDTLVLLFCLAVMIYGGAGKAIDTFAGGQELAAMGIAKGWVYLAVPVGGLLTAFYAVASMISPVFAPDHALADQPTDRAASEVSP